MHGLKYRGRIIITILMLVALFTPLLPGATPARAQEGPVRVSLTEFEVQTIDGKNAVAPLMAGSSYKVHFTLEIAQGVKEIVFLETDLSLFGSQFWELKGDYAGINPNTWAPGRRQIQFRSEPGKASFILTGIVPSDFTTPELVLKDSLVSQTAPVIQVTPTPVPTAAPTPTPTATPKPTGTAVPGATPTATPKPATYLPVPGFSAKPVAQPVLFNPASSVPGLLPGFEAAVEAPRIPKLHLRRPITLLHLTLASGVLSETKSIEVIDKAIENYTIILKEKQTLLKEQTGEPKYVELITGVIARAQTVADEGHPDLAIEILNEIPNRGWPQSPRSLLIVYGGAGLLGILALLFFMMMFRAKGEIGYTRQALEDEVKRLDIINIRASRLGDRGLIDELKKAKEELERISGR
ncbi:MAG: hypothetical protein Q8P44_06825 [Dehalococcoidia bacterium]|nr:hypothetical protein [Dehalococcoidia bacterium]